jgi:large subunit ribosomal protein L22
MMMEIKAVQKFVRMSPRKLRLVTHLVKDLKPAESVEVLPYLGKRAAGPLLKVIKTAIANAKVKGINQDDLVFKEIQINEGPRFKRGRAAGKGRWHPYKKRTSHIRVVLQTTESKTQSSKSKIKSNDKNAKTKEKKAKGKSTERRKHGSKS